MILRQLLAEQVVTYGGWCSIPSPFVAEMMAHSGVDWVCVDCQHGFAGNETLLGMLQAVDALGVPSLVRVPWNDPAAIMKALDAGAGGVIVPMVNTPQEAAMAAQACRYPPDGFRSWGFSRHSLRGRYTPDSGNRDVVCAIQIETTAGLEIAEDIVSVPGVDAVYVGPADLAVSAGIAPTFDVTDPRHEKMITTLLRVCLDQGRIPGIHAPGPDAAARWRDAGFRFITAASDVSCVRGGAQAVVAALRQDGTE